MGYCRQQSWVLLWAPGTPNTLSEMAKLSLSHLIYKGTVTRSYESLSFSSAPLHFFLFLCFVFFSSSRCSSASSFCFIFLCFFSRTLLLPLSRAASTLSSSLLLGVGCCCWLHLLPGKLSFSYECVV